MLSVIPSTAAMTKKVYPFKESTPMDRTQANMFVNVGSVHRTEYASVMSPE